MSETTDPAPSNQGDDRAESAAEAKRQMADAHPDARTVSLVVLTVLAVFAALYVAQDIVIPIVLAIVLNLMLNPAKRFLCSRLHFPAALASLLLILALFSMIGAVAAAISLPASSWVGRAPEALPKLQEKLGPLQGPIHYVTQGIHQIEHLMDQQEADGPSRRPGGRKAEGADAGGEKAAPPAQAQNQAPAQPQAPAPAPAPASAPASASSGLGGVGMTVLAGTRAAIGQLFTIVVILFFLLWAGDTLLRSLVEIMPRFSQKRQVVEIAEEVEHSISGYLATITMMNLFVGVANGLATWACGLPDPLLWGTLAFLLNYIPILGPFTGVAIFFVVGLFTYSVLWWAFLPAGIYLAVHILEGETITPMLLANRFTLNPVLVMLSLFFWDWMWGVIGALLAVPLLAMVKILCDHIPVLTPLGHLIGGGRKGGASPAT